MTPERTAPPATHQAGLGVAPEVVLGALRDAAQQAHGFMHYGAFTDCEAAICVRRFKLSRARLSVADGPGPEERPDLEAAARAALAWLNEECWPDTAEYAGEGHGMSLSRDDIARVNAVKAALRAALPVHREELGHGTPVPEEAELPSGDARIEGLDHQEEPSR